MKKDTILHTIAKQLVRNWCTPVRSVAHASAATSALRTILLLVMMAVEVNGVKADGLPFVVTTDKTSPNYYLIQSAQIESFYMIPYSTTNNVSTSNVPCAEMRWYFMASGTDGYYHIIHSSGKYLSCASNGTIQLEDLSEGTPGESHQFSIEAIGSNYYIRAKGCTTTSSNYVTKNNGNVDPTDYIKASASDNKISQWKFIPSNAISWGTPEWLTTGETKKYYRIKNVAENSFYLSTNTGTSKVNTSSDEGNNRVWYFKEASSDSYITYYYIINAETEKYLCFDGTDQSESQDDAASIQEKGEENEQNCQFIVVQTAKVKGTGEHQKIVECYAIIPKLLKDQIWGNNSIALKNNTNNTNVCTKSDRTDPNNPAHWTFEAVTCADPVISFDESTQKVTLTSATTGASIYYTTGDSAPTVAIENLYNAETGVTVTADAVTTIKAIAYKEYGTSGEVTKTVIRPTITLETGPFNYDGTAKEPAISAVQIGGADLNTDTYGNYVVEYKDNTNAGTAKVILREAENNTNIIYGSKDFTINKVTINSGTDLADGFSVRLVNKDDNPYAFILYNGETELVENVDYEVVGDVTTSGQYTTRTIHPIGNYSGDNITIKNANVIFNTDEYQSEWSATFVAEGTDNSKGHALPADGSLRAYIITKLEVDKAWAIAEGLTYIPEGIPVLLVSLKASNGFLVKDASGHTPITIEGDGNQKAKNMLEVRNAALANVLAGQIYWLYNNEFVLNMAGDIPANKVYLNPNHPTAPSTSGGGSGAPPRLSIRRSESTDINVIAEDREMNAENSIWYTLDGRRLNSKPTQKGLYITKDRKVIIK